MTGFSLLFRREIERRWTLLLAPVLIGVLVAVLPLFDVWHGANPGNIRGVGVFMAALLWAITLAIGLGVVDWPAELRARRLAFDFRLPVRGGAIWSARALAAVSLTLAGSGIILLVSLPFGMELESAVESLNWMSTGIQGLPYWTAAQFAALVVAGLVLLYLFVQALAVALNGHRGWAVVAAAALVAADLAVWLAWQHLGSWFAVVGQRREVVLAIFLAIAGLAVSIAWQAIRGRSEPDRAQRALIPALVIASLAIIGCAQGYASWFLHPGPSALHEVTWGYGSTIWQYPPAAGKPTKHDLGNGWTLLEGAASGRPGLIFAFAEATDGEGVVSLGPNLGPWVATPRAALSADGSRLAWPVVRRGGGRVEATLYTLDTTRKHAKPRRSLIVLPRIDFAWALSPNGDRIVSTRFRDSKETLLYDDLRSGRRLAVIPLRDLRVNSLAFEGPDRLSAVGWTLRDLQVGHKRHRFTIDLKDGSVRADQPPTPAK